MDVSESSRAIHQLRRRSAQKLQLSPVTVRQIGLQREFWVPWFSRLSCSRFQERQPKAAADPTEEARQTERDLLLNANPPTRFTVDLHGKRSIGKMTSGIDDNAIGLSRTRTNGIERRSVTPPQRTIDEALRPIQRFDHSSNRPELAKMLMLTEPIFSFAPKIFAD
jgi:hypothetical protein